MERDAEAAVFGCTAGLVLNGRLSFAFQEQVRQGEKLLFRQVKAQEWGKISSQVFG